jgi:hypothetical protein
VFKIKKSPVVWLNPRLLRLFPTTPVFLAQTILFVQPFNLFSMKKGAIIALFALAATAAVIAADQGRKPAATPATACCNQSQCDPGSCDEPCEPFCCE